MKARFARMCVNEVAHVSKLQLRCTNGLAGSLITKAEEKDRAQRMSTFCIARARTAERESRSTHCIRAVIPPDALAWTSASDCQYPEPRCRTVAGARHSGLLQSTRASVAFIDPAFTRQRKAIIRRATRLKDPALPQDGRTPERQQTNERDRGGRHRSLSSEARLHPPREASSENSAREPASRGE